MLRRPAKELSLRRSRCELSTSSATTVSELSSDAWSESSLRPLGTSTGSPARGSSLARSRSTATASASGSFAGTRLSCQRSASRPARSSYSPSPSSGPSPKASQRPLPVVVDTPLARLDLEHRRRLLTEYLPNVSHQVVVLSTDTEVDVAAAADLEAVTARRIFLAHDLGSAATAVEEGYFSSTEEAMLRCSVRRSSSMKRPLRS